MKGVTASTSEVSAANSEMSLSSKMLYVVRMYPLCLRVSVPPITITMSFVEDSNRSIAAATLVL